MKKHLFFAAIALWAGSAMAQPALSKGNENRYFTPQKLVEARYVGQEAKHDVWLTEGKRRQMMVTAVNANLWPDHEVLLPKTADMDLLAASCSEQKVSVMVADHSQKRATLVGRFQVNLPTYDLKSNVMDTLARFNYGKKDECMLWSATSPSGKYSAVVAVVMFHERHQYRATAILFDDEMNLMWQREVEVGTLEQLTVTDEGRIVGMGLEEEGEQTTFVFTSVDAHNTHVGEATLRCGALREVQMVGVVGAHAMAVATIAADGGRKRPTLCSGELALSFHLDSAALTGYTLRDWQNEDINIFVNQPTKKTQKELMVENMKIIDAQPMSYGFSAVMGRCIGDQYHNTSGDVVSDFYTMGLHWISVDTLGRIRWVRNVRRNDMQEKGDAMLGVCLVEANGHTALVKMEHPKYPLQYDIAKEVKPFEVGKKGNLVVYSADDEGVVEKLVVEKGVKLGLVRAFVRPNGNLVMLRGHDNKTSMAELMYKY